MNNLESLAGTVTSLADAVGVIADTGKTTELRMHALLVCMAGVLRTAASDPALAAKLASEISNAAEGMHAVAMGYPLTDDFLAARNTALQRLLPPELQKLVQLPQ